MSKKREIIYDMTDPKYWEQESQFRSYFIEKIVTALSNELPEPREPKGFEDILKDLDSPKQNK